MTTMVWAAFLPLVGLVVALDPGVFHRKAHVVSLPEALGWTSVWVSLSLAFNVGVYYMYELNPGGWDMDTAQLTDYVVEKSLSVDNIFVIAMIFAFLRVPLAEQHRVLFWGILSVIFVLGAMIFGGLALLERFDWLTCLLGGALVVTPLLVALVLVETADVMNEGAGSHVCARRFTVWQARRRIDHTVRTTALPVPCTATKPPMRFRSAEHALADRLHCRCGALRQFAWIVYSGRDCSQRQ